MKLNSFHFILCVHTLWGPFIYNCISCLYYIQCTYTLSLSGNITSCYFRELQATYIVSILFIFIIIYINLHLATIFLKLRNGNGNLGDSWAKELRGIAPVK